MRVIGNNAVHPGQIDVNDSVAEAASLFGLLNFIIEEMITKPKEIERLYGNLPASTREAIQRRDGQANP